MDTLGALALATEPPTDELMERKPVGRKGNFITNVMWRNIMGQSLYQFVVIWFLQTKGKAAFNLDTSDSDLVLNTLIFNCFVFCQVSNIHNIFLLTSSLRIGYIRLVIIKFKVCNFGVCFTNYVWCGFYHIL